MRSQLHASADNESLQADVMRFMAIIAFCLIAILALVKDTPPPDFEPEPGSRGVSELVLASPSGCWTCGS